MANVLNRATLEFRRSVNTPDFPSSDWVINPDLTPVEGVENKYWKLNSDILSEMNPAEKIVVDDIAIEAAKDAIIYEMSTGALAASIDSFVIAANQTRAILSLPDITSDDVRTTARGTL